MTKRSDKLPPKDSGGAANRERLRREAKERADKIAEQEKNEPDAISRSQQRTDEIARQAAIERARRQGKDK